MAATDLGRVCPILMGAYDTGVEYTKLDIVSYAGSSYIAKTTTQGNAPTNAIFWQLLAEAGDFAGTGEGLVGANLLDNWDMRKPVNQRQASPGGYTVSQYLLDRWLLVSGRQTIATDYMGFDSGTVIEQRIEDKRLAGRQVTVSVMIAGDVLYGTESFPTTVGTVDIAVADFGTVTLGYHADYLFVRFTASAARQVTMFKLELGTVSTLDRQPPMDYQTELIKAQRYFVLVESNSYLLGYTYSTTGAYINIPCNMRPNPIMEYDQNGAPFKARYAGNYVTGGTYTAHTWYANRIRMEIEFVGLTANNAALIYPTNAICLSSDL